MSDTKLPTAEEVELDIREIISKDPGGIDVPEQVVERIRASWRRLLEEAVRRIERLAQDDPLVNNWATGPGIAMTCAKAIRRLIDEHCGEGERG